MCAHKSIKVAVLRARHDLSEPYLPERACIEMIMTNTRRTSVLNYWEAVTHDHLDFVGSALFPWVDIAIGTDDVSRGTQCTRALAATAALPGAILDGFDMFMVLSWPGQISMPNPLAGQPDQPDKIVVADLDGGAGPTLRGKPACALPVMTSNHTFMCHELGHLLGFRHSYGVLNNGIDWDGMAPFTEGEVYGDPYDIMSSATFGTRQLDPTLSRYRGSPTFIGPRIAEWHNPNAFSMGPPPAQAHLHLWDAAALGTHIAHRPVPAAGQTIRCTLTAAGRRGGVQLIAVHPGGEDPSGRGRCYVEYRQKGGWDAGLDVAGNDLARQAVVVHTLADTAESVRCWYRGRILVPLELDSDLMVAGTPLSVRVESADVAAGTVEIAISTGANRGIELYQRGGDEVITVLNPQSMSTPCGDPITYGTHITQSLYHYQPVSYGFGGTGAPDAAPLRATWTVGGVQAMGANGTLEAPTPEGTFTVTYAIDPITAELSLSSRGGEKYRAEVIVTMTEADGTGATTATTVFAPLGYYDGHGPGDSQKISRCMAKYAKSARLHLRDYLIPPGPNPLLRDRVDRINQERMPNVITRAAVRNVGAARALAALTAMRYGVRNR